MGIDYKNPKSVLGAILALFQTPNIRTEALPTALILATKSKPGMSPSDLAGRIIARQSKAGLSVGPLPSGKISSAELMEQIRCEEIIKCITTCARIDVAIQPGTTIVATGANAGGPVPSTGVITGIASGNAQIS